MSPPALPRSVLCADIVGWGDNLLGLRPFSILGNVIVFNNMVSALVLSPLILIAVYPRVQRGRMLYADVMPEFNERRWSVRAVGTRDAGGRRGRRVADGQPGFDRLLGAVVSVGVDDAAAVRQADRDRREPVYPAGHRWAWG